MSRSHPRHRIGIIALVAAAVAACEDSTVTHVEQTALREPLPGADLAILAPEVRAADLVQFNSRTSGRPLPSGAVLSEIPSEGSLQIRAARTTVGIHAGRAYAEASHEYTGTLGLIQTTVSLAFDDQHVASQTAIEQEWTWLPLSVWRKIRAIVGIDADKSCGLSVSGTSRHETSGAFFDLNKLRSVPGPIQTSQANTFRQSSCGRQVSDQAPSSWYDSAPAGMTCLYLITYDRVTYHVVDVALIGCSTSGTLF
jgi:hypothetical protein